MPRRTRLLRLSLVPLALALMGAAAPIEGTPGPAMASMRAAATSTATANLLASPLAAQAPAAPHRVHDRVWIPELDIDDSVASFACTDDYYPKDRVYRWGCAGEGNVYLFGHAHSVFKPLHDAYVEGRLRIGLEVVYADGAGLVSTYRVRWWRITTPDDGAWAYAAQDTPSLTLQTCVGDDSQYRLIVRLARVA